MHKANNASEDDAATKYAPILHLCLRTEKPERNDTKDEGQKERKDGEARVEVNVPADVFCGSELEMHSLQVREHRQSSMQSTAQGGGLLTMKCMD